MGVVYRARDPELGREVALKVVDLHGDEAELERFRREGVSLAQLRHAHVVEVHDLGVFEGRAFLAMAYVRGESLAERLRRGSLEPRQAAELVALLCDAVAHAHAAGVLHRDLKPANVLLDEEGRPRLTDFGLAKVRDATRQLTETGGVLGTPAFMAPEQIRDAARVDERADVYGLGAILYAALCAQPPFSGATTINVLHAVLEGSPTPPRELAPELPPGLEAITLRALARAPQERQASAADLGGELRSWLGGEAPARQGGGTWAAALLLLLVLALAGGAASSAGSGPPPSPLAGPSASPSAAPSEGPGSSGTSAGKRWLSAPRRVLEHPGTCRVVRFLGGGRALSAGGGAVVLWDLERGARLRQWAWTGPGEVRALALEPEGYQRFLAVGSEGTINASQPAMLAWGDVTSSELEPERPIGFVLPVVDRVSWSATHGVLLGFTRSGTVSVLGDPRAPAGTFEADSAHAHCLTFQGEWLVIGRWNKASLQVRSAAQRGLLGTVNLPTQPWELAGGPRRHELVVACAPRPDEAAKGPAGLFLVDLDQSTCAAIAADASATPIVGLDQRRGWVYAASQGGELGAWRLETRERVWQAKSETAYGGLSAAPRGRELLVIERESPRFQWWDLSALEE